MALNAVVLKTAIIGALQSSGLFSSDIANKAPATEKFIEVLTDQIITHFKSNAVINSNVTVVSVSGVTTGPGISGPGTGSGLGTIS